MVYSRRGRVLAVLLSFALVIIVAEVSLRLIAWIYTPEQEILTQGPGAFRIALIGNSHTAGYGSRRGTAYPNVLDKFFLKHPKGQVVRAFNISQGNGNTRIILERLDDQLKEFKPHVAIAMVGEPNFWNPYGYGDFIREKNGTKPGFLSTIKDGLMHVRLFRWLALLPELYARHDNDREAYELLAKVEATTFPRNLTEVQAKYYRKVIQDFLKEHGPQEVPNRWLFQQLLAHIEIQNFENYEEAIKLYEETLGKSGKIHIYFYFRDFSLQWPEGDLRTRAEILAKKGQKIVKVIRERIPLLNRMNPKSYIFRDEDVALLEEFFVDDPTNSRLSEVLMTIYQNKKDGNNLMRVYETYLKNNPLQMVNRGNYFIPDRLKETKARAEQVREELALRFPAERKRFDFKHEKENWMEWDITLIVRKLKANGAVVVLQTYHWLKHREIAEVVNPIIRKVALKEGVLLLDTEPLFFERTIKNQDLYYTKRLGKEDSHPSEHGHLVIAEIIFEFLKAHKLIPDSYQSVTWEYDDPGQIP